MTRRKRLWWLFGTTHEGLVIPLSRHINEAEAETVRDAELSWNTQLQSIEIVKFNSPRFKELTVVTEGEDNAISDN